MNAGANSQTSLTVLDIPDDCGNAPRKAIIRDFTVAFYSGDKTGVLEQLSNKIEWSVLGSLELHSTDAVEEWIVALPLPEQLKINTIITHGSECGVDGVVVFPDGSSVAFCHIFSFTGASKTAKIKVVRTYNVALTN